MENEWKIMEKSWNTMENVWKIIENHGTSALFIETHHDKKL